jgi:hypothetical protein
MIRFLNKRKRCLSILTMVRKGSNISLPTKKSVVKGDILNGKGEAGERREKTAN